MSSDLSDRYNDGIVETPDVSTDVPPLHQPDHRPTKKEEDEAKRKLVRIVIAAGGILAAIVGERLLRPLLQDRNRRG